LLLEQLLQQLYLLTSSAPRLPLSSASGSSLSCLCLWLWSVRGESNSKCSYQSSLARRLMALDVWCLLEVRSCQVHQPLDGAMPCWAAIGHRLWWWPGLCICEGCPLRCSTSTRYQSLSPPSPSQSALPVQLPDLLFAYPSPTLHSNHSKLDSNWHT